LAFLWLYGTICSDDTCPYGEFGHVTIVILCGGIIMAHSVNKDLCIGCGVCEDSCPLGAISADAEGKREVNADLCVDCGTCAGSCPVGAIAG